MLRDGERLFAFHDDLFVVTVPNRVGAIVAVVQECVRRDTNIRGDPRLCVCQAPCALIMCVTVWHLGPNRQFPIEGAGVHTGVHVGAGGRVHAGAGVRAGAGVHAGTGVHDA